MNRRGFLRITAIGAGLIAAGGYGVKALIDNAGPARYSETRSLLGTYITINIIDEDEKQSQATAQDVFSEIARLSNILSRHDSTSELSLLNSTGHLTGASSELVAVLEKSQYIAGITGGAFDVTVKPVLDLYQSSFEQFNEPPTESAVAGAMELVGYEKLTINGKDVSLAKEGMCVTLDGIAKGYIIDEATALLKARGLTQVLVEAGGDLALRGMREDGQPWKVGVIHPRALAGYYDVLNYSNGCMATSGDYESSFTADYSYHHIIDPRTGFSPAELCSATVLANDTTFADALSTAAMVMGSEAALAFLKGLSGVEAMLINKDLKSYNTPGFVSATSGQ